MRVFQEPGLWKADIDGAFRRIPVRPEHRWATAVAYMYRGVPMTSTHNGMPFGASSSVVAWHRIGEVLAHIARRWALSEVPTQWCSFTLVCQAIDAASFPICGRLLCSRAASALLWHCTFAPRLCRCLQAGPDGARHAMLCAAHSGSAGAIIHCG